MVYIVHPWEETVSRLTRVCCIELPLHLPRSVWYIHLCLERAVSPIISRAILQERLLFKWVYDETQEELAENEEFSGSVSNMGIARSSPAMTSGRKRWQARSKLSSLALVPGRPTSHILVLDAPWKWDAWKREVIVFASRDQVVVCTIHWDIPRQPQNTSISIARMSLWTTQSSFRFRWRTFCSRIYTSLGSAHLRIPRGRSAKEFSVYRV